MIASNAGTNKISGFDIRAPDFASHMAELLAEAIDDISPAAQRV